jgi:predicted transposase/invertase (TIGR01784 family)
MNIPIELIDMDALRKTIPKEVLDKFDLTLESDIKEILRFYRMRQMAIMDFNSSVRVEREEGEQIGLQKGRLEGQQEVQLEIAKNLIEIGLSIAQISSVTGLSPEEIKQLE